jgi:hypothetical protein
VCCCCVFPAPEVGGGAAARAGAGASDSAVASAIASAFTSAGAGAYFDTSAALAAASTPIFALSPRLREKVEDLQDALLEFQVEERARQKVDKEAADAHGAHCRILAMIRRCGGVPSGWRRSRRAVSGWRCSLWQLMATDGNITDPQYRKHYR